MDSDAGKMTRTREITFQNGPCSFNLNTPKFGHASISMHASWISSILVSITTTEIPRRSESGEIAGEMTAC